MSASEQQRLRPVDASSSCVGGNEWAHKNYWARRPIIATGGWPQFVDQAYRQVAQRHRDRIAAKQTIVIVADTLPMQMAILRDGLSHAQVGQRPREMGYRAMVVLRELAAGGTVEDAIYTGLDVCTTENASTCVEPETAP